MPGPESKLLQMSDHEQLKKQIILYIHMLFNDVICFCPANKSHSSLHWDCIPFFVESNQSIEKPVQSHTNIFTGQGKLGCILSFLQNAVTGRY